METTQPMSALSDPSDEDFLGLFNIKNKLSKQILCKNNDFFKYF